MILWETENLKELLIFFSKKSSSYIPPWKYNIRRNVDSDLSIVTIRRVAIIFFELGVVKNFMETF